ncbi:MAG: anhydro-N-acetylmuramic acid kinase, partial [Vulcanimicrobiaceae bacterium]
LRRRLEAALPPHAGTIAEVAQLHAELGAAFVAAARAVVQGERVDFVATHGLTLYHDGMRATTLQIGRPYELRDALQATVVWDFRSADCALGGEGAPLVPFVDLLLFASADEDRVAVNLGGICNLTILRRGGDAQEVLAFDAGPGVMLLDAFVRSRSGEAFDRDGRYAAAGAIDEEVAAQLLADPYFSCEPPKSTGRERFGAQFLDAHAAALKRLTIEDGCATLAAVTIRPLVDAIRRYAPRDAVVVLGGGGARNRALVRMLEDALRQSRVVLADGFGINADAKEAIAFAILGYETLRGRPANLPRVTGARAQTILGSIVPHELSALVTAIARETEAADR